MPMKRLVFVLTLLALARTAPASAQATTVTPDLTLRETLFGLIGPTGSPAAASAIALAASLETTSGPLGTSSGGFVFKLDPSTGLQARTATTFGPSFAERALTSGEGKVSAAASIKSSNYDRLGDASLEKMLLGYHVGEHPRAHALRLYKPGLVVDDAGDVRDGWRHRQPRHRRRRAIGHRQAGWVVVGGNRKARRRRPVVIRATGAGKSSGLGDVAGTLKYRFMTFGEGLPDPGGIAVIATVHLPTGDAENFRGMGITRTYVGGIVSFGRGRLRPHFNGGYERWSDGIEVVTDFRRNTTLTARDQIRYAAGVELEAAPKLTLLLDLVGRRIRHAGEVGSRTEPADDNVPGITAFTSAVAIPEGIQKLELVPGLKLNVKGTMLFSLNVLTTLMDNGLHARVTPVASIDLTF